ncbi:TonB-dependent receptor [Deminuibacter soli]|uniref:TonB-dependent receptor n=1 Tax=Deminuibacter soli TaxID=2291815 RepID=A0A3E1NPQ7_9BACT|nr:TonB-dependent receptor [Deminuibacter soli]RFM29814.1 TonB-dependent receptor [Deminuibacter soli]
MRSLLFFCCFILSAAVHAQTVVSGVIRDHRNKPLPGASITLKDTYDGAVSDSTGAFHFTTTEKGNLVCSITCMGFKTIEQPVSLTGTAITLNISLKEQLDELRAVTVTAGAFSTGARKGAVMSSLDVATTAGSNADITAALKTLPGTQQVGEQEGLFVRGGAGYETKQFIDGTMVNNFYNTSVPDIAQRGRFSPFLFKGTVFSTGGYSALYGQALSSVLLLESIDVPEKSEIDLSVSPLFWGVSTQQVAKDKKSSWGINYSYVNVGLYFKLVKQTPDYYSMPRYHNVEGNFRIKTKRGGIIKYYTTFGYNELGLRRPDIDSLYLKNAFGLTNHNWYNNLSYKEYLNNGWKLNMGVGYSTNRDDISQQIQDASNQPKQFDNSAFWMQYKNFRFVNRQDLTQTKIVLEKKLGGLSALRFGTDYWYSYNNGYYNDTLRKLDDHYNALYAESDIFLTNDLAATVGARYEHSSIIGKSDIAPRASLAYKTGKNAQVSVAYGEFYQKPENMQLYYTRQLGFTRAAHYIVNYLKMNNSRTLRVEAYYKKYHDLVKAVPVNYYYSTYDNSGTGYARGFELFWRDKKSVKNLDYWISYSYVDTKRNYLNYTTELQPNYAATHTASVVLKRFFTSIKCGFNFTYTYATGRPYYNFMLNNGKYNLADQGKTKDYNTLNFSMEYVPSIGKANAKSNIVLFASANNILGNKLIYGYNYSYSGLIKQPITPPANRGYFIGCFISWGVDRTDDVINNNL